jgi:hypothetical protein
VSKVVRGEEQKEKNFSTDQRGKFVGVAQQKNRGGNFMPTRRGNTSATPKQKDFEEPTEWGENLQNTCEMSAIATALLGKGSPAGIECKKRVRGDAPEVVITLKGAHICYDMLFKLKAFAEGV